MITLIKTTKELQHLLLGKKNIGFVPTMGNLHKGHLSLIKASLKENQFTVISIYVNPTQFSENEDFDIYPRTLNEDIEKIQSIHKESDSILIFSPQSDDEIYPNGKMIIKAPGPTSLFEGAIRSGHFDGMATVVKRLFEIVRPQIAYFGQKDYQQLLIVKELIKKFDLNIQIHPMPIIRDNSGLALSSRNGQLTPKEIQESLTLYQTLSELRDQFLRKKSLSHIQTRIKDILASDKRFNYLAIANAKTLEPPRNSNEELILLGNLKVGNVRLLDNLII